MNLLQEYPKALTTVAVGVIFYFGRQFLPELFTQEVNNAIEVVIGAVILILLGRFTRIKSSEANELSRNQL